MKSTVLSLILLMSFSAQATQIISTFITNKADGTYTRDVQFGFGEDGFTSPSTSCYIGMISEVCDLVEKKAGQTQLTYFKGGHGYFEVKQCGVSQEKTVDLIYKKKIDYDGAITVGEVIKPCFK